MGGLDEHLVCHSKVSFFVVLSFLFFGLFVTRTGRTGRPILTIYTSYDVFPRKDVPLGAIFDITPHTGVKSSKTPNRNFQGKHAKSKKLPYSRNYRTNSNKILQNDKDHQMLFVSGPNTLTTCAQQIQDGGWPPY